MSSHTTLVLQSAVLTGLSTCYIIYFIAAIAYADFRIVSWNRLWAVCCNRCKWCRNTGTTRTSTEPSTLPLPHSDTGVDTLPYWLRFAGLADSVVLLICGIDNNAQRGILPVPAFALIAQVTFALDMVCGGLWVWFTVRALYRQLNRRPSRAISTALFMAAPLYLITSLSGFSIYFGTDRSMKQAVIAVNCALLLGAWMITGALTVVYFALTRHLERFMAIPRPRELPSRSGAESSHQPSVPLSAPISVPPPVPAHSTPIIAAAGPVAGLAHAAVDRDPLHRTPPSTSRQLAGSVAARGVKTPPPAFRRLVIAPAASSAHHLPKTPSLNQFMVTSGPAASGPPVADSGAVTKLSFPAIQRAGSPVPSPNVHAKYGVPSSDAAPTPTPAPATRPHPPVVADRFAHIHAALRRLSWQVATADLVVLAISIALIRLIITRIRDPSTIDADFAAPDENARLNVGSSLLTWLNYLFIPIFMSIANPFPPMSCCLPQPLHTSVAVAPIQSVQTAPGTATGTGTAPAPGPATAHVVAEAACPRPPPAHDGCAGLVAAPAPLPPPEKEPVLESVVSVR